MGKMSMYILLICSFLIIFHLGGATGNNSLINLLFNPENIRTNIYLVGITAMSLIGLGTAAVLYWTGNKEMAVMTGFTTILGNFLWEFISIYTTIKVYSPILAILVISPLLVLLALTIIEWWRGRD